jgi:predicted HicB family RNase H-like nuclease
MTESDDHVSQLVTRIPERLRRRVKIHCVEQDTTLTDFVIEAIVERLERAARRRSAR